MANPSLRDAAQRLRIYIGESDHWRGQPLYAALLEALKAQGLAGATVLRGVAGFGAHSRVHTAAILRLSEDLPLVIEVVDTPERIAKALEVLEPMVREGLITLEDVRVVRYTHRYLNPLPADRPVAEVMTQNVITLTPELTVSAAWLKMLESRVKVLPVVDSDRRVLGILTDQDLLERAGLPQRLAIATRIDAAVLREELRGLEQSQQTVAEVMSTPVLTARQDEALGAAVARMIQAGLKRLPVVDQRQRLVGMLSRLDILRVVAAAPQPRLPETLGGKAGRTLREVMRAEIPTVQAGENLGSLVDKFLASGSHRLVVVDERGRAIGLISDSDVVARIQPARQPGILAALRRATRSPKGAETAQALMSPGPLTAAPDLPVVEAVQRMITAGRKWLVVVDPEQHPLGLVDRQVLFESLSVSFDA